MLAPARPIIKMSVSSEEESLHAIPTSQVTHQILERQRQLVIVGQDYTKPVVPRLTLDYAVLGQVSGQTCILNLCSQALFRPEEPAREFDLGLQDN